MPVEDPQALSTAFAAAINERDLPAALDLWMEDAAIVRPDGQMLRGKQAIAGALQALIDSDITIEVLVSNVFVADPVAAATGTLTVSGTDGNGDPFEQRSQSVVMYSRGPDGWRLAMDAPWGLPQA